MPDSVLGINLCFAVKRYLEPQQWAQFIREDLGLTTVQFTFDLADPWWPDPERTDIACKIQQAADDWGLSIDTAFVGLAHYVPAGLLDPDPDARRLAVQWWRRAIDLTCVLGARALGGPLGTMSVADAADDALRQRRYQDLLTAVTELGAAVREAGLEHLLIEPTPIQREIPHHIDQAQQLGHDLDERQVPFGWCLDTGHTVYQPLYGPEASAGPWIDALGDRIQMVHLDNTDGLGDPHWGWPHPQGRFDVADFGRRMRTAGLAHVPIVLEIYPRFEDDDEQVRRTLISSVTHCKTHLPA
jgi:D-erythrulose 1-phosphate 3-epimerase